MYYNILIADDIRMNRTLVIDILRQKLENINFHEAKNGLEVLERVKENEIDLIILDLIMPEMDGYQVIEYLKNKSKYSNIPIIISSAIHDIESIEQTLKNGASDYFTKPLSPNDMNIILPLKVKNLITMYEQKKMIISLNNDINNELANANKFQNIMLPKSKKFDKIDVSINFKPCFGIGGDFFDCANINGKNWFMIADVSGHGIAAGMASAMVKILFRTAIKHENISPSKVLKMINDNIFEFMDSEDNNFSTYTVFTGFVGCIYDSTLIFSNGGHPYPVFYSATDRSVIMLEYSGPLIGAFETAKFEDVERTIKSGDSIILYTDGIFSSGKNGDFNKWNSVKEYVKNNSYSLNDPSEKFLENMFWFFHMIRNADSMENNFEDDVAIMLIKIK